MEELGCNDKINVLNQLNADEFVQKTFTSGNKNKKNILIDLNTQTITVPKMEIDGETSSEDNLIHSNVYTTIFYRFYINIIQYNLF